MKDDRREAVIAHDTDVCAEFINATDIAWTALGRGVLHCSDPGPWTQRHAVLHTFLHTPYKENKTKQFSYYLFSPSSSAKGEPGEKGQKGAPGRPGRVGPPGEIGIVFALDTKRHDCRILLFLSAGENIYHTQTCASPHFFPTLPLN